MATKSAVQFGAGSIGRGFVAQILHASGYDVIFADVDDEIIAKLQSTPSYHVREVGEEPRTSIVDGYRAINSRTHEDEVVAAIANADIVTTAVGEHILQFIAPAIALGLRARSDKRNNLTVIACEAGGTDILAAEVRKHAPAHNAVFANCAIDRIVPQQEGGLDVTIESYFEWAVERAPFKGNLPEIVGVTWVDDLAPHIERTLFTVKAAEAAAAYRGHDRGRVSIREALATAELQAEIRAMLAETMALLVAKQAFDPHEQRAFIEKTIARISNPQLPNTCERVGRNPMRKLSRNERFIGPAAQLAELGLPTRNLLGAFGAALRFDVRSDEESIDLQELLNSGLSADELAARITGLSISDPLYPDVVEVIEARLNR